MRHTMEYETVRHKTRSELRKQAQLSRDMLTAALLEMLKEMPLREISISMLANHAGVDRRTFYRHYERVEDILYEHLYLLRSDFAERLSHLKELDTYAISYEFFSLCQAHRGLLLDLYRQGMMSLVLDEFNKDLPALHKMFVSAEYERAMKDDLPYAVRFYAGGFWNLCHVWLADGAQKSPSEMAAIVDRLVKPLI